MFLWQAEHWPALSWDASAISFALARARVAQGFMLGRAASLDAKTLATAEVQAAGEEVEAGVALQGDRTTAARVTALHDRVTRHGRNMSDADLQAWHRVLAPEANGWRRADIAGRPAAHDVPAQMRQFFDWFNRHSRAPEVDGLVRAAIAHLWVEAIAPFDGFNASIAGALADLAIGQDVRGDARLWSLTTALVAEREACSAHLQQALAQDRLDVTPWVQWYLERMREAFEAASARMEKPATQARFWARIDDSHPGLAPSQRTALARLLDGSEGLEDGLSTEKYVAITGVSRATAYRELTELVERGLLVRGGQGRATRYALPPDATS